MAKPSTTFTVAEVAQLAGVCKQTVRRKIDSGKLPAKRIQGAYRITEEAVRAWLQSEGYSTDRIDRLVRRGVFARANSPHEIAFSVAYTMGQNFAFVIREGLNAIQHSTVIPEPFRFYFSHMFDIHPDELSADLQKIFWSGFNAPTGGPVSPLSKTSQKTRDAFLEIAENFLEDPERTRAEVEQALAKVDGKGDTEHGEQQ